MSAVAVGIADKTVVVLTVTAHGHVAQVVVVVVVTSVQVRIRFLVDRTDPSRCGAGGRHVPLGVGNRTRAEAVWS